MMSNIESPGYSDRLFLGGVVRRTLLYAAPVWWEILVFERIAFWALSDATGEHLYIFITTSDEPLYQ